MPDSPFPLLNILSGALGGAPVAWWLIRRSVDRVDRIETRITSLETKVERLATKEDVATKDDWAQVSARLDRVDNTLVQVQVMLGKLEVHWEHTRGE